MNHHVMIVVTRSSTEHAVGPPFRCMQVWLLCINTCVSDTQLKQLRHKSRKLTALLNPTELETMADIKHGGWSHTMYTDKETQWICDQVSFTLSSLFTISA